MNTTTNIIHRTGNTDDMGAEIVVAIVRTMGALRPCVCYMVPAHGPYPERLETQVLFGSSAEAIECADSWAH